MIFRLPEQPGEWIDRSREIEFSFEGTTYTGYSGDVVASALMANGVRLTGRSFKYHRPRGVSSLAGHDANAMLSDRGRTHLRADGAALAMGMDLRAVNTFGSLVNIHLNPGWRRYLRPILRHGSVEATMGRIIN